MSKPLLTVWLVCGALAITILGVVAWRVATHVPRNTDTLTITPAAATQRAFALTDENGAAVTHATYAGRHTLVFFGFTHCPAICPSELLKIADVLTALGDQAARLTPLFITVDPERDTATVLKTYTNQFSPAIIGLTGTAAQIQTAIDAFGVYATRVPQGKDYTMDHSTFLYLMDPQGVMIKAYKMDDDAATIADDLKKRL
jgi:protein SCO1/2